jgi:cytochrome c
MKKLLAATFGLCIAAAPLLADGHATGDSEAGEKVFKKCKACHAVIDADGNAVVKGGRVGPNLYGIYTRKAGSFDGFNYGDDLVAAGEAGLEWDEASFVEFVADPKQFLRDTLDDKRAKSAMGFKLKKANDQADVWAYLVSIGPETAGE